MTSRSPALFQGIHRRKNRFVNRVHQPGFTIWIRFIVPQPEQIVVLDRGQLTLVTSISQVTDSLSPLPSCLAILLIILVPKFTYQF